MITVFFGDNTVLSRRAFLSEIEFARKKVLEILRLEGKSLDWTNFTQVLESDSLFQSEKAIFIEDLFFLPKSSLKEKLFSLLKKNSNMNVFIWEGKNLTKTQQGEFPKGFLFRQYKIPAMIFKFLDGLKPENPKKNLENFHHCLLNDDPEMIFQMIIRQVRLLTLAKDGEKYLPRASWQKAKILSQSKLFSKELLKDIYRQLLKIDFQQKTSQVPLNLASSLDLLISEI